MLQEEKNRVVTRLFKGINKYLDLSLVREPMFIMMVCSVMTMSVGVPHVLFFIPTYAKDVINMEPAFILSATSIADLFGRILFGFILDANLAPKHIIYALMIMASGCSVIGLALSTNAIGLIINMLVYGLGSGAWFLMVPLLLAEYLGMSPMSSLRNVV